ncbi:fumarylacetoacetate hydrolase family protein [Microbacterium ulmi]|uniref:Fumarylacetoacetate hydrolase family protein n=2 Tax=Microbacterium ulmi TaxID=179095 RepID=A0A7Y2M0B1_9MICO|nr:fumarylacetoacetate hydrolase family protein [Microbacterium ulmi]NNH04027.1 fumarylacetoacetate hydrolase family protein [Microbacterium ulmi]
MAAAREDARRVPLDEATLLPASPHPSKIFCVGLNYREHVEETKRDLPSYPVLFPKFASNLISADSPIQLPPESEQVDWEGELAVIIGRTGRRIAQKDAFEHILGFAVANDVTVRDYQYKTHQWLQGKAWDGSTPLGPWIVTPDEVDLDTAGIRTILNDEVVQESQLSRLIFDIPRLVSEVSQFTVLEPGDVILTGTPGGVGYRRDPKVFLTDGDVVRVQIDGVGEIISEVVNETIVAGSPTRVA